MLFRQLFDRDSSTYTYILADEDSREAVIIDPVLEQTQRDLKLLSQLELKLLYSVETHVHADHITAAAKLKQATNCQIILGQGSGATRADILIPDLGKIHFGKHYLTAISTPGHTNGCTTYVTDDNSCVFTGDALLIRACGRTDFQNGSSDILFDSISRLYSMLPDTCKVYPGHDYTGQIHSTIGEEKKHNPRLFMGQTKDGFGKIMSSLNLPKPMKIDAAVPANVVCGFDV
eukprot:Colp12_sorted_trinity150504_noHs@33104